MQPEKKLNFKEQLKKVESNVNKTIGIICKLQNILPRSTLLTIYKSVSQKFYEKIPFHDVFSKCVYSLSTSQFFCSGNPISHILEANNSWLSWTRGNCYIGKMPVLEQSIWFFKLFLTWFTFKHFQRVTIHYFNYL